MNLRLFQFRYSAERDLVDLYLKVSIGATGAPTIVLGKGITSITRNSAGKYTILLKGNANKLMDVSCMPLIASAGAAAPMVVVDSEQVANVTTPQLVLQMRAIDNTTATDPASGEVLMIKITLRNAST